MSGGAHGALGSRDGSVLGGVPGGGVGSGEERERRPDVLYVRFSGATEEGYPELLALLTGITPVVEALPPDAALADVGGALRYFGRDAAGLGWLVRCRALAHRGTDCTVGVAANPLLARMAAYTGRPGEVRVVPVGEGADFLADLPVEALHGVGPAIARTLRAYGLESVGRLAAAPLATVQRVLGATVGRQLAARANGIDPTSVTPNAPARSVSCEHRFGGDELDGESRRRALLTLAEGLGFRMRSQGRVAGALTLTVRYADRSTTTRTRTLAERTAHTPALAATAYALHEALGLQRARVRAVVLRAEGLTATEGAARQLSFDRQTTSADVLEPVLDRINSRWPGAVRPASLAEPARRAA